jgi:hypothetical protein
MTCIVYRTLSAIKDISDKAMVLTVPLYSLNINEIRFVSYYGTRQNEMVFEFERIGGAPCEPFRERIGAPRPSLTPPVPFVIYRNTPEIRLK